MILEILSVVLLIASSALLLYISFKIVRSNNLHKMENAPSDGLDDPISEFIKIISHYLWKIPAKYNVLLCVLAMYISVSGIFVKLFYVVEFSIFVVDIIYLSIAVGVMLLSLVPYLKARKPQTPKRVAIFTFMPVLNLMFGFALLAVDADLDFWQVRFGYLIISVIFGIFVIGYLIHRLLRRSSRVR